MKDHFLRLFQYDKYANNLLLQSIHTAGNPQETCRLMNHLLAVQHIWLERCQYKAQPLFNAWPDLQPEAFAKLNNDNHQQWIDFLQSCNTTDFSAEITYKNSKGDEFTNLLQDIITHVINHGTHHRAQIGQFLKFDGLETLPVTDYILYLRNVK